jgi:ATP phosphoribosyltransferase regulatory subunit
MSTELPSEPLPRSLEHPLPAGMRDLLPEEAAPRRALARRVLDVVGLHGYALLTLPAFEFAEVLERGLGTLDPADVLRFVEPESGEVAALRPDMTPQIARVIATRLCDRPPPMRLAYEGTVLRRRSGRARKHRQIPQVGVELAGVAGPEGDLELLALAAEAMRAAGLERFTLDLGDAGVVRALLADRSPGEQRELSDGLARKDEAAVTDPTLRALLTLEGGRDAIVEGTRLLARTPAAPAVARLLALFDAAVGRGLEPHLRADLAEVRGFAYYTGTIFHAYAPGAFDAVLSGGRYDELLARFGFPMAAAGFAMDLHRAEEARAAAGCVEAAAQRVVIVGAADDPRLAGLRARGIAAVAVETREAALDYARAWGFTHLLDADGEACVSPKGC